MKYTILDSDVFSDAFRPPETARYGRYLRGVVPALTFVSVAEVYFGAYSARWGETKMRELDARVGRMLVLPFDGELPRACARLRAEALRRGHPLAQPPHANDLWIAACAVHYGAPLLTGNVRHFAGLPELDVIAA